METAEYPEGIELNQGVICLSTQQGSSSLVSLACPERRQQLLMDVVKPAITHDNNPVTMSAAFFNKADDFFDRVKSVGWALAWASSV